MEGRLLELTFGDPYANVAFEEALLNSSAGATLRIWFNQKSVVIGRAQLAGAETDLGYCETNSIPVVRRCTAGGAVYHGPGNLNWTFLVPGEARGIRQRLDANGVFGRFAPLVVEALARCGVKARFVLPNSVFDEKGKVSGMAAYVSKDNVLCHGTLLCDADLEEVVRLTTPSTGRFRRKYPRSRAVQVSNCGVSPKEFVQGLMGAAGGFERGRPTSAESRVARGLIPKYRSREWNLGDPFA